VFSIHQEKIETEDDYEDNSDYECNEFNYYSDNNKNKTVKFIFKYNYHNKKKKKCKIL
jgi:hypothetical protein